MAGNTYDIRLRGNAESVVQSFGSAGRAVVNFARLLGPGGVAVGAISGFKAALNPLTIGLSLLGAKLLSVARDGVAAFQSLERQAIQTTYRIHQSSRAMTRDIGYSLGVHGGPGNVIAGMGVGLQAGLSPAQSRLLGRQGARAHLLMGDDPADAARRILAHAQAQGIGYSEAGQQLYSVPPGVGRLDFLNRFAGAERARAMGNIGQTFDPVQNIWQGFRERRRLMEIGFWDIIGDAFSPPDEGYLRRGGQHSRGRRGPTFSADQQMLARFDELRRRETYTRLGFQEDVAAAHARGAAMVSPEAQMLGAQFSSSYLRRRSRMLEQEPATNAAFNDAFGVGLVEVREFVRALGTSKEAVNTMGASALAAAYNLGQVGPTTDPGRVAALTARRNDLMARAEATGGASLAGTPARTVVVPGTGEVRVVSPGVPSADQAELNLIEAQLAALQTPGAAPVSPVGSVAPRPAAPFYFPAGVSPSRREEITVDRDENLKARGIDIGDLVVTD